MGHKSRLGCSMIGSCGTFWWIESCNRFQRHKVNLNNGRCPTLTPRHVCYCCRPRVLFCFGARLTGARNITHTPAVSNINFGEHPASRVASLCSPLVSSLFVVPHLPRSHHQSGSLLVWFGARPISNPLFMGANCSPKGIITLTFSHRLPIRTPGVVVRFFKRYVEAGVKSNGRELGQFKWLTEHK